MPLRSNPTRATSSLFEGAVATPIRLARSSAAVRISGRPDDGADQRVLGARDQHGIATLDRPAHHRGRARHQQVDSRRTPAPPRRPNLPFMIGQLDVEPMAARRYRPPARSRQPTATPPVRRARTRCTGSARGSAAAWRPPLGFAAPRCRRPPGRSPSIPAGTPRAGPSLAATCRDRPLRPERSAVPSTRGPTATP